MLLLLRGLPASGKSDFVYKNHLQDYTVSSDSLRHLLGSNELGVNGTFGINQKVSQSMWGILYDILDKRFEIGAFTVLDATNIKTADISKVYKKAKDYRYRVYCVDFTDVPVEECIRRDAQRPENKQVGKSVLYRMNESLKGSKVPGGIKVIKPEDWLTETRYRLQDLSNYKKINHIGDIHACYTALQNYLNGDLKDDEYYIFLGDYIDRGLENVEMINFIHSICEKENVVLLEGNHEIWLNSYVLGEEARSKEFEEVTKVQLDKNDPELMKRKCKLILNKLRQCFIYKWNDKVVLCTHGGLSKLPANLSLVNTEQMIKGVGLYKDMLEVNKSFAEQNWDKEVYQVHGHRNVEQVAMKINNRCFNLCGQIEYGGNLRSLELDEKGFHPVLTPNPIYKKPTGEKFVTVSDMKDIMKDNDYIKVVQQKNYPNISSFNFTRDAFSNSVWNDITTKARGLFINDNTNEIVARGYNKFFNINERPETNIEVLPNTLYYPVKVYKKENGFLGLLGFDKESDSLLFCSKSEIDGEYSDYFKNILLSVIDEKVLYEYLKPHNVTLTFEVVDIDNDPHIIKYDKSKVVLLDIIENNVNFKSYNYEDVKNTAELLGLEVKEECKTIHSGDELTEFFEEISVDDYKWNGRFIEGFVFKDENNFMFKYKCEYYKFWKFLRGQVEAIASGKAPKIDHPFLKWVMEDKTRCKSDIIALRREFSKGKGV